MAETTNTNDLRRGMVVELSEGLFQVLEFQHHKPGKGQAVVRTKLRNLRTGAVLDRTFNSDTKVGLARLDRREMQYLYRDGERFVFMDNESYEQIHVDPEMLGDSRKFLKDGTVCLVPVYEGIPVGAEMPVAVPLKITETEPGLKGDRVSGALKPATVETGAVVQVPLFVEQGETIRVDTRSGEYMSRA